MATPVGRKELGKALRRKCYEQKCKVKRQVADIQDVL